MGDVVPFRKYKLPPKQALRDLVEVVWCPELERHVSFYGESNAVVDGVIYTRRDVLGAIVAVRR